MEETIMKIRKRSGDIVDFDRNKIFTAINKAMVAAGEPDESKAQAVTDEVVSVLNRKFHARTIPAVEEIQDIVEEALINNRLIKVAKGYILYRDQHA